eukprot:11951573-Karenia_brevis.AAC.1
MGMPDRLLRPLRHMYSHLCRRFRVTGAVGREFRSTNGILQGCPLSVVFLIALVAIWCKAVRNEVPEAATYAYTDDTGPMASRPKYLQAVLNITEDSMRLTGQELN